MSYHFLTSGAKYRVTQAFVDFDRRTHPVGEEWTFLRTSFLPYDDGLSIFVTDETGHERQIRMQWRDEEQGPIIERLSDYLTPA
ncbi:DUF3601 domain-containing protein [Devosia sediminis]|uniref:DUF3601 domain-containing protein n=1 Tax=Devosia sediminis TaxID=2798801 RepID=A0A934IY14_9HYPH|nr:DUF3601 domain-containing protein [Devosia sediminis]MBJ3784347.1 DUF3601 domain-containing protein [Devosia sediminis]